MNVYRILLVSLSGMPETYLVEAPDMVSALSQKAYAGQPLRAELVRTAQEIDETTAAVVGG